MFKSPIPDEVVLSKLHLESKKLLAEVAFNVIKFELILDGSAAFHSSPVNQVFALIACKLQLIGLVQRA